MSAKPFSPRFTPEQLRDVYRRRGYSESDIDSLLAHPTTPDHPIPAKGEKPAPGDSPAPAGKEKKKKNPNWPYKSKAEVRVALFLAAEQAAGRVREWRYEAVTLSLALPGERCRYTPDFFVWLPDGRFYLIEVKGGYCRDDARVKLLAARAAWPMMGIVRVTVTRDGIDGMEQIFWRA